MRADRHPGQRSRNARCARCNKVRKMHLEPNYGSKGRVFSVNIAGEGKVCWICRIREIYPEWRPGMLIPKAVINY